MNNDWSINNVTIPMPQIQSKADHDNGQISLVSEIAGRIMEEVIATKAAHVRARLIELGWTPPEEPEHE